MAKKNPLLGRGTAGAGAGLGGAYAPTLPPPVSSAPPVTPPPTTTAPPPGSTTITSTPDYQGLITGAGDYVMGKGNLDASNLAAANLRQSIIRNAVAHFGAVPDFSKLSAVDPTKFNYASDLDPLTGDLASQNTAAGTSVLGQLSHTHDQNVANLRALLASRGILNSGQDALMESEEGRNYAGNVDTATQSLFDALTKAQQDYLGTYTSNQQALASLGSNVANRLQGENSFDPSTFTATLDPGSKGADGSDVYKDANGNYWTKDGHAVSSSSLQKSTPAPPPAAPLPYQPAPAVGHTFLPS